MTSNLALLLEKNVLLHPNKPAFIFKGKDQRWNSISYQQFLDLEISMEKGLTASGFKAGTKAVLMVPADISFFALTFAMLKTGITAVMIDPAIGLNNVTRCLAETKPDVFIGTPLTHGLRSLFGWGKSSITKNITPNAILDAGRLLKIPYSDAVEALSDAAIIFTSGSTGLPKGAIYTHKNLQAQVEMLASAIILRGDEIDLPAFPIFAMIDLLLGVTAVIPDMHFPRPAKVDPALIIEAIQNQQVDTLFASPVVLDRLARYAEDHPTQLASLKRVITAGAPAPVAVLESFFKCLTEQSKIYGIYGSTESLPIALVDCHEILSETRFASEKGAGICVGRPVDGINVDIIAVSDEALNNGMRLVNLPRGTTGEIVVEGAAVTTRYSGKPEYTLLAKTQDSGGLIHHRTGDVGYFDDHGRLWYCGRKSHRVQTSNGLLFSEQVEGIFNAHPDVYRTALVGVQIKNEVQPVLWVELKDKANFKKQEKIRQELLTQGDCFDMTREVKKIFFRRSFPTDVRHNSKIIREKLAVLAQKRMK